MHIHLVKKFWEYIDQAEFDKLKDIMIPDANVWLPNTNEVFTGAEKYITFNKKYPGRWFAEVHSLFTDGTAVISIVKVSDEEGSASFYVTSVFNFANQLISEITEYWGENGKAPQWRLDKELSEHY